MSKELLTSNPKLRVIEPFRMYGYPVAEVFVSSIGLPHALALQFDTEDNGEASITLTAREAYDLMLWLQCALNQPCDHEWETVDEGSAGSEFQPPDPAVRQCCLCGKREST